MKNKIDLGFNLEEAAAKSAIARKYMESGGFARAFYGDVSEQAVEGLAIEKNKLTRINGRWMFFEKRCFKADLDGGWPVRMQVGHNDNHLIASTDNSTLSVIDGDVDVSYRLHVSRMADGPMIAHMVASGSYPAVSVGIRMIDFSDIEVEGYGVRVVHKAVLEEISLVKRGAVPDAFAAVVDTAITPAPSKSERSYVFEANLNLHRVGRKLALLQDDIAQWPVASKRTYTVAELNHAQTRDIEALQRHVRSRPRW